MLTFIAFAGRLASPLLAFVPGFNPKVVMVLAGLLGVCAVIGGPAGAVWLHMRGEVRSAATVEQARCEISKAEDARANAESLAALLDRIAKAEADEPKTPAEEKKLCAKSKLCRGPK
jgi:hypothetical protein